MTRLFSLVLFFTLGMLASAIGQEDKPEKEKKEKDNDRQYVYQTFKDTRLINTNSVEVLQKREFDVRIGHRFGNFMQDWKPRNAWETFIGMESSSDISMGVEYGVVNNLTLGFHRTKGAGSLRLLLHGIVKYRIMHQTTDAKIPISMTVVGIGTMSTMPKVDNPQSLANFSKFAHRFVYGLELHLSHKFPKIASIQVSPMFVWRNIVPTGDENALFALALGARFQATKTFGIILDTTFPMSPYRFNPPDGTGSYFDHIGLGVGFEFETGGHVFQFALINSAGMMMTDYVPNTDHNWGNGEFRLGFTISRVFRF